MAENVINDTVITDLNEDCLIEVCRHLKKHDLYNFKLSNKTFGKAIDYIVATKEFHFEIYKGCYGVSKDSKIIGGFLKLFGGKIKYLSIFLPNNKLKENERIKCLIEKYCLGGNIKRCLFDRFELIESFFDKNIQFFDALESLNLFCDTLHVSRLMDYIATTTKLKEFDFTRPRNEINNECNIFRAIASSKLEICCLRYFSKTDLTTNIDDVPMNRTLKVLDVGWSVYDPAILTKFLNIERVDNFNFSGDYYSLGPILLLPALKSIELRCVDLDDPNVLSVLKELAKQNKLESFGIEQSMSSSASSFVAEIEMVEILSKMTNLKKLKLYTHFLFKESLARIGSCLTNLQELKFDCWIDQLSPFNKQKLAVLLKFLKNARNVTKLDVPFLSSRFLNQKQIVDDLMKIRKAQGNTKILCIKLSLSAEELTKEQRKYIRVINTNNEMIKIT